MLPGAYKVENYQFEAFGVVTNKCAFGAYRGFGGPEAAFAMEVMLNKIAKELSIDPAELRTRNLVTNADFPFTCVTGMIIENGTFTESIRKAMEMIGHDGFLKQQEEARRNGRYLGIGISCNVETTVPNICYSTGIITGHDFVKLSIGRDGKLTVFSGVASIGTGVETSLAQVAADSTGIEFDDVSVVVGDTQSTPYSTGPWGSRVAAVCGAAIMDGGQKLREKVLKIAAHLLEARYEDLRMERGEVFVAGSPKSKVSLSEIAEIAISSIHKLPRGTDPGLEITTSFDPPLIRLTPDEKGRINVTGATNNSAHVCVVEVDVQTGSVKILRYVIVHDVGNMINPAIVEGQVIGGAVQSVGGTLYEELVYDRDGQLLTSTLMDYLLPSAVEAPKIELHHYVTPTPYIPGGFKGAGESGTVSVPACITNAVINALEPFGVSITQTPLTPEKVWRLVSRKNHRGS
jgi:carbon-monoxide dehydrogenase large subunit